MRTEAEFVHSVLDEIGRHAAAGDHDRISVLVSRIRETLDSAPDVRKGIAKVFAVQGLDRLALRLLWLLDKGRVDGRWPDDVIVTYEAKRLLENVAGHFEERTGKMFHESEPDLTGRLSEFSAHTETLKRDVTPSVRRLTVQALKEVAQKLTPFLGEAGKPRAAEVLNECVTFIEWAQKHKVDIDDKAVAMLHTANVILQTSVELGEGDCEESISRALEVLRNPERVFGIHVMHTSEIYG